MTMKILMKLLKKKKKEITMTIIDTEFLEM